MSQIFRIYLETDEGPATITSRQEFNSLGRFSIAGPGKKIAREWIEGEYGAFGHLIGRYAAPCDLHYAAMSLQQEPEEHIRFVRFEGKVETYDSGLPDGAVP